MTTEVGVGDFCGAGVAGVHVDAELALNMYSNVARSCVASKVEIRDCLVHIGRSFEAHYSSDIICLMKVQSSNESLKSQ